MARFSPDRVTAGPLIQGFAGGGFRIDGALFPDGALLTPDSVEGWIAPMIDGLEVMALAALLDRKPMPEFLLLGTGATLRRPPAAFTAAVEAKGIGVEAMDSRAAARAWGVLRAEGREVVAALLPLTT